MRDEVALAAMVLTFAALVTVHVLVVAGLLGRKPRWRAPLALVVVPLAPYFAMREKMRVRAVAWVTFGVAYLIARLLG